MTEAAERLLVYVGFAQRDEWEGTAAKYARHARVFEQATDAPCVVLSYEHATPTLIERLAPEAVVLSGYGRSFHEYAVEELRGVCQWLRETRIPTLALCGSHQLLGFLFNGELDRSDRLCDQPMRRLHPDEPVTNPDYHPEYFMERGFYAVELLPAGLADPLFAGLGPAPRFYESHYCEIKTLPPGFVLLASTPECRIQAMRHRDRLLYGLQFHPDEHSERFPDGRRLLESFFRLASRTSP